jgi:uncharacterized membrane protein YjjB (DUF3815 family)
MLTLDTLISVLSALVGTFGFGVLFCMKGRKLLFASLGGMFAWFLYLLLFELIAREILCYLIVSTMLSLYSEFMARWLKTPATPFAVMTLIPLIPGGSLYYSIDFAVSGNWESFAAKAAHTAGLAAALSVGIVLVHTVCRHIKWHPQCRKQSEPQNH